MFKTILFDVDGTLIDTEYVMTKSLQKTLFEEKGIDVPVNELQFILVIPGKKAIKRFVSDETEMLQLLEKWSKNILVFSEYATLFPEVKETIKSLKEKGFVLGLVISKTTLEMQNEFVPFDLNHYFEVVVTASDTQLHKPNPDPIQKAIDLLGVDKAETIYIGNSIYDMKSAKSCGVQFGLAEWGALKHISFDQVDFTFQTPKDVLNQIHEIG